MFDIGFWELILISIMGLVILGPERLPGAIRSVLAVVNKVKQSVSSVTTELKQELELDELHQNLKKAEQQGLESLNGDLSESFETLKARAESVTRPYQKTTSDKPDVEKADPANTQHQADTVEMPADSQPEANQEDKK
ncbi:MULTISPECIES: Sec-independent protein translocase protein TatB [unclassified Agarivorans]|uniref:Sec-independent protein translocase protein TatB n=1 Tax=unclassified Agarivorans TaxID=2636026 RepID=UPI0026E118FE|nr:MULTISPECIES: Sec-independent protein translocase protein TatB [unclassified Agarivorans]MDO6685578.1 Sec-independent protein translocase protein TatB [Agarivorans sp. 3_MG-2023]MDO6715964.1 Sec-independent protein translocase protein TatB [Agarivorans sp. 2_MG-2023]MDO6765914.1 Sec-independent protein translocase protein TatB [Agarivorans sp. 1_MG-2023]